MTSTENIENKVVSGADNLEASENPMVDSTIRTYSKPFDVTAKEDAERAAEKVVAAAKKMDMENAEKMNTDANVKCHQGV